MPRNPEALPAAPPASPPEEPQEKKKRHLRIVTEEEAAEDLTHELDDAEDPERWYRMYKKIAPDMTDEAQEIDPKDSARWKAMYKEIAPDMTEEAELVYPKDEERWKKAHEALAPDMTDEAELVDPKDKARYEEARAALDAAPDTREVMPSTPPPIPAEAKKPSLLKRIGRWFRG